MPSYEYIGSQNYEYTPMIKPQAESESSRDAYAPEDLESGEQKYIAGKKGKAAKQGSSACCKFAAVGVAAVVLAGVSVGAYFGATHLSGRDVAAPTPANVETIATGSSLPVSTASSSGHDLAEPEYDDDQVEVPPLESGTPIVVDDAQLSEMRAAIDFGEATGKISSSEADMARNALMSLSHTEVDQEALDQVAAVLAPLVKKIL